MPAAKLSRTKLDAGYNVVDLFFDAKLCPSKSEARRLVEQGGAFITKSGALEAIEDVSALLGPDNLDEQGDLVIRAGKKRFCRVMF